MQLVGRVFPVNSYLRRIDKHPTGACPFGCKDETGTPVRETITHFQSCCPQFEDNRTAAHHAIAKAVMGALAESQLQGWEFFYETPFDQLPFDFEWTDEERERQQHRRPDGVALHRDDQVVLFLEFTRCMDHPHTMQAAIERKEHQYDAAVEALRRAQNRLTRANKTAVIIRTVPMVFGVRGAVAYSEACEGLDWFRLTPARRDKILAQGVREAITGASALCTARFAALRKVPGAPRLPNGKRQRIIIPQKPYRPQRWRGDRGGGGHTSAACTTSTGAQQHRAAGAGQTVRAGEGRGSLASGSVHAGRGRSASGGKSGATTGTRAIGTKGAASRKGSGWKPGYKLSSR